MTMGQALVTGTTSAAEAAALALSAQGWQVRRAAQASTAALSEGESLLVIATPADDTDGAGALDDLTQAPARLASAMAEALPPASLDSSGEQRASGQVILILDPSALTPGAASPARVAAQAAALGWMRGACLSLAPGLRLNAIACAPSQGAQMAPVLDWLTTAHAVTGQMLRLGDEARPPTEWRR